MAFGEFFLRDTTDSPVRARWLHLPRSGSQSQCRIWFILPVHGAIHYNEYGLLTKCEVKMAGYWPSSFCACLGTETKSRSKNSQKTEQGQYPAIWTKQTWSIEDLLCGFRRNCSCRTQWVVLIRQDGSILPARVANHSAGFDSSCPFMELFIIMSMGYWPSVRSRWLDIGQVLFLHVYGPRWSRGP